MLDHQNKSGKTHQGYFWAYHDPLDKQTFFKYEPTRAGAYPAASELGHYMYDGGLHIDNNWVENAIRPIAIGRKTICSRVAMKAHKGLLLCTPSDQCKRQNLDAHRWLTHVFENILDTKPSQYHSLLPQNYVAQKS